MMRNSMASHDCLNSGLDWHAFLELMRTFEDLLEEAQDEDAHIAQAELKLKTTEEVDEYLDLFTRYIKTGPKRLSSADLRQLVGSGEPGDEPEPSLRYLTDAELVNVKSELKRLDDVSGTPGTVHKFVALTKELRAFCDTALTTLMRRSTDLTVMRRSSDLHAS